MFYKQSQPDQRQAQPEKLTRSQMDLARKAFRGKLVRMRFSPPFIVNNADDLLGIAHSEYARAVRNGVEIEDPVAWTIHCAWRRTQNLLQAESTQPRMVSSERIAELVDDGTVAPEEEVLDEERARKVREAVARLDPDQQKVIALTFFEEMSVREAARHLGCSASSVQHRRETALRTLRRFLPVRVSDELQVDVAMGCWLAIAVDHSGFHLPAGFEAVIDRGGHGVAGLWAKAQDLARRFTVGGSGETATAVASGGAGRAVGVCATGAAIVCLAGASTGLVGPGIGALGGGGGHQARSRPSARAKHQGVAEAGRGASNTVVQPDPAPLAEPTTESTAPAKAAASFSGSAKVKASGSGAVSSPSKESTHRAEAAQAEEEFSGIARAGSESTETEQPAASASDEGTEAPTVVHTEHRSSKNSSSGAAAEEFGFEH